jgi:serine/threonine protein kinase
VHSAFEEEGGGEEEASGHLALMSQTQGPLPPNVRLRRAGSYRGGLFGGGGSGAPTSFSQGFSQLVGGGGGGGATQFLAGVTQFPMGASQFPEGASQFPVGESQFPAPPPQSDGTFFGTQMATQAGALGARGVAAGGGGGGGGFGGGGAASPPPPPPPVKARPAQSGPQLPDFGLVYVPAPPANPFLLERNTKNPLERSEFKSHMQAQAAQQIRVDPRTGAAASHYLQHFQELALIGAGSFSSVFRVRGRIDGCVYAVKKRKKALLGHSGPNSAARTRELREVLAMAALSSCPHILHYRGAWTEKLGGQDFLYIQMELAWGSLEDAVEGRRPLAAGWRRGADPSGGGARGRGEGGTTSRTGAPAEAPTGPDSAVGGGGALQSAAQLPPLGLRPHGMLLRAPSVESWRVEQPGGFTLGGGDVALRPHLSGPESAAAAAADADADADTDALPAAAASEAGGDRLEEACAVEGTQPLPSLPHGTVVRENPTPFPGVASLTAAAAGGGAPPCAGAPPALSSGLCPRFAAPPAAEARSKKRWQGRVPPSPEDMGGSACSGAAGRGSPVLLISGQALAFGEIEVGGGAAAAAAAASAAAASAAAEAAAAGEGGCGGGREERAMTDGDGAPAPAPAAKYPGLKRPRATSASLPDLDGAGAAEGGAEKGRPAPLRRAAGGDREERAAVARAPAPSPLLFGGSGSGGNGGSYEATGADYDISLSQDASPALCPRNAAAAVAAAAAAAAEAAAAAAAPLPEVAAPCPLAVPRPIRGIASQAALYFPSGGAFSKPAGVTVGGAPTAHAHPMLPVGADAPPAPSPAAEAPPSSTSHSPLPPAGMPPLVIRVSDARSDDGASPCMLADDAAYLPKDGTGGAGALRGGGGGGGGAGSSSSALDSACMRPSPLPTPRVHFSEGDLLVVLCHIARALRFMHERGLAHLDVKPANILVTYEAGAGMCVRDGGWLPEALALTGVASFDEELRAGVEAELAAFAASAVASGAAPSLPAALKALTPQPLCVGGLSAERLRRMGTLVYKLGDLGQAVGCGETDPFEGDSRYLARELMQGGATDLPATDVFALGMTLFELASGSPLPAGGAEYHALREALLPRAALAQVGDDLYALLCAMVDLDPARRPTAAAILSHPLLVALPTAALAPAAAAAAAAATAAAEAEALRAEVNALKSKLLRVGAALGEALGEWDASVGGGGSGGGGGEEEAAPPSAAGRRSGSTWGNTSGAVDPADLAASTVSLGGAPRAPAAADAAAAAVAAAAAGVPAASPPPPLPPPPPQQQQQQHLLPPLPPYSAGSGAGGPLTLTDFGGSTPLPAPLHKAPEKVERHAAASLRTQLQEALALCS